MLNGVSLLLYENPAKVLPSRSGWAFLTPPNILPSQSDDNPHHYRTFLTRKHLPVRNGIVIRIVSTSTHYGALQTDISHPENG